MRSTDLLSRKKCHTSLDLLNFSGTVVTICTNRFDTQNVHSPIECKEHFCIYMVLRTSIEFLPAQINPVGFVTETSCVYRAVRIVSSNIAQVFFFEGLQDRQHTYNLILRRIPATIVAVEMQ
jgi:hypothetical protein